MLPSKIENSITNHGLPKTVRYIVEEYSRLYTTSAVKSTIISSFKELTGRDVNTEYLNLIIHKWERDINMQKFSTSMMNRVIFELFYEGFKNVLEELKGDKNAKVEE